MADDTPPPPHAPDAAPPTPPADAPSDDAPPAPPADEGATPPPPPPDPEQPIEGLTPPPLPPDVPPPPPGDEPAPPPMVSADDTPPTPPIPDPVPPTPPVYAPPDDAPPQPADDNETPPPPPTEDAAASQPGEWVPLDDEIPPPPPTEPQPGDPDYQDPGGTQPGGSEPGEWQPYEETPPPPPAYEEDSSTGAGATGGGSPEAGAHGGASTDTSTDSTNPSSGTTDDDGSGTTTTDDGTDGSSDSGGDDDGGTTEDDGTATAHVNPDAADADASPGLGDIAAAMDRIDARGGDRINPAAGLGGDPGSDGTISVAPAAGPDTNPDAENGSGTTGTFSGTAGGSLHQQLGGDRINPALDPGTGRILPPVDVGVDPYASDFSPAMVAMMSQALSGAATADSASAGQGIGTGLVESAFLAALPDGIGAWLAPAPMPQGTTLSALGSPGSAPDPSVSPGLTALGGGTGAGHGIGSVGSTDSGAAGGAGQETATSSYAMTADAHADASTTAEVDHSYDAARAIRTLASQSVTATDVITISAAAQRAGVSTEAGTELGDALADAIPRAAVNSEKPIIAELQHANLERVLQIALGIERQAQFAGQSDVLSGTALGNAIGSAIARASDEDQARLIGVFTDPALATDEGKATHALQIALGIERQSQLLGATGPSGTSFVKNTPLGDAMAVAAERIASGQGDPEGALAGLAATWGHDGSLPVATNANVLAGLVESFTPGIAAGPPQHSALADLLSGVAVGRPAAPGGTGLPASAPGSGTSAPGDGVPQHGSPNDLGGPGSSPGQDLTGQTDAGSPTAPADVPTPGDEAPDGTSPGGTSPGGTSPGGGRGGLQSDIHQWENSDGSTATEHVNTDAAGSASFQIYQTDEVGRTILYDSDKADASKDDSTTDTTTTDTTSTEDSGKDETATAYVNPDAAESTGTIGFSVGSGSDTIEARINAHGGDPINPGLGLGDPGGDGTIQVTPSAGPDVNPDADGNSGGGSAILGTSSGSTATLHQPLGGDQIDPALGLDPAPIGPPIDTGMDPYADPLTGGNAAALSQAGAVASGGADLAVAVSSAVAAPAADLAASDSGLEAAGTMTATPAGGEPPPPVIDSVALSTSDATTLAVPDAALADQPGLGHVDAGLGSVDSPPAPSDMGLGDGPLP